MKWELSIGNLIQVATVAALLIVWGARQESLNEEARKRLADVDARVRLLERSEAQIGVEVAALRRDLSEVKSTLNEVVRLLRNGNGQ
jgi:hypothetical protein